MTEVPILAASAENLIQMLRPSDVLWQPTPSDWIFRGQWDSAFSLTPSANRKCHWEEFVFPGQPAFDPETTPKEGHRARREIEILRRFQDDADRAGIDLPNEIFLGGRFDSVEKDGADLWSDPAITTFTALAQHHGVPMRMLDWTRSGLHAAYFAAVEAAQHKDKKSAHLSVWALSKKFVDRAARLDASINKVPRLRVVTCPRASNPNLHAQAGLFTLWYNAPAVMSLTEVVSAILLALSAQHDQATAEGYPLRRINLPWAEAPKLLRLLSYEQVDAARMFPGRDGVVKGMKERKYWDQPE